MTDPTIYGTTQVPSEPTAPGPTPLALDGASLAKFRIENVVASTSLGEELDLHAIARVLGGAEYEPEQFPGLVYRINEPKVVILLFGSGKVVCTGARKPSDVEAAVEKITAELRANGLLHLSVRRAQGGAVASLDADAKPLYGTGLWRRKHGESRVVRNDDCVPPEQAPTGQPPDDR